MVHRAANDLPCSQAAVRRCDGGARTHCDGGRRRPGQPHVGLWLGAGANVVHYPVRAGREVAVVIIVREPWPASAAESRVDAKNALAPLAAFHHSLTDVLSRAPDYRKWALYRLAALPTWSLERIGLIGDAAHPVLPHLAQGGALALEDGLLLG